MIKIAHEAPLDIFDEVQRFTDYDYALVHLLEENPRYRDTFERAIKKGEGKLDLGDLQKILLRIYNSPKMINRDNQLNNLN